MDVEEEFIATASSYPCSPFMSDLVIAEIAAFEEKQKAYPPALNKDSNEIDFNSGRFMGHINGPCGEILKTSIQCYMDSSASIKGVDCADNFKQLVECCKENKGSCHPRITKDLEDE